MADCEGHYYSETIDDKYFLLMNFTIFLLFFGVSVLEAFQSRNWIKAGLWLAIGIVFLAADNLKKNGDKA